MRYTGAALLLAASCAATYGLSDCDPITPDLCMLPFPNNFWLRNGHTAFTNATFPTDNDGHGIDVTNEGWNKLDGFSPLGSILTYFAELSLNELPQLWSIGRSVEKRSPSILLEVETGRLIPHWTELDRSSDGSSDDRRALLMWPAFRLRSGSRYIVAYRNLKQLNGSAVEPSPAFLQLRDKLPSSNPDVNERRALFETIFSALEQSGWSRGEVVQAWDFNVGSRRSITGGAVHMRDDAFQRVNGNITYHVDKVTNNFKRGGARLVQGHFMAPWYLNQVEPGLDVRLVTDREGLPVFQKLVPVNFSVVVPDAVANGSVAGRAVYYGHGLFGSQNEIQDQYLVDEANQYGYVYMCVDWLGLASEDVVTAALMVATDLSNFPIVPDRLHQGMLNALLSHRLLFDQLPRDPAMQFGAGPVVNASWRNYYGNSDGGILGGVFMALTTDTTHGVLGVPGAPYTLLLPRSLDFASLYDVLKLRYSNSLARISLYAVLQLLWDRMDPAGYLDAITDEPLANTPRHHVQLHYGLADAQVTWLGAKTMARSVGAHMWQSNVVEGNTTLFGLPFEKDSAVLRDQNMIIGWDFGEPDVPFINVPPPSEYDTHEFTRRTPTAQAMTARWFHQNEAFNACGGACKQSPPV